jgi:hypothetical protein
MNENERRVALVAAIDRYTDAGLRRLRAPSRDAEALARVPVDRTIGKFEVEALIDVSHSELSEAVEELFADAGRDDLILLHLSCHGLKNSDGDLSFAAADTKLRRLASTAVSAHSCSLNWGVAVPDVVSRLYFSFASDDGRLHPSLARTSDLRD